MIKYSVVEQAVMGKIPSSCHATLHIAAANRMTIGAIMSIPTLYLQGLQLMLMGMGFVFIFLGLLVALVSLMSQVLNLLNDRSAKVAIVAEPVTGEDLMSDPELISVITTAVQSYRKQQQESN